MYSVERNTSNVYMGAGQKVQGATGSPTTTANTGRLARTEDVAKNYLSQLSTADVKPVSAQTPGGRPSVLYRGDGRHWNIIFKEGFQSKEKIPYPLTQKAFNQALSDNAQVPELGVISTSRSEQVARRFASVGGTPGYVYTLNTPPVCIDVNHRLQARSIHPDELEFASLHPIPPEDIMGAQAVNSSGQLIEPFIPNPNYKPKESSKPELPLTSKL